MKELREFLIDSYLPYIPEKIDFSYLKLFYLLPKLKELIVLRLSESKSDFKNRDMFYDVLGRIEFVCDFILEKSLFLSWEDEQKNFLITEIDSLKRFDYTFLASSLNRLKEALMRSSHWSQLFEILTPFAFSEKSPDINSCFELSHLISSILQKESYKRWKYCEMTSTIALIGRAIIENDFPYAEGTKNELKSLLFTLLKKECPQKDYSTEEKQEEYLCAANWYISYYEKFCLPQDMTTESLQQKIEKVINGNDESEIDKYLSCLTPEHARSLSQNLKYLFEKCEEEHVTIKEDDSKQLDSLRNLFKKYWEEKTILDKAL
ncbi:MAG: hypothetical protein J6S85_06750 [Methanobrevibacter sp.]|nr:hypothetical protein [Methanobrevibacter sp.]